MELEITNNETDNRFETYLDSHLAFVKYTKTENDLLIITSTQVPKEIGGRGVAGILTKYVCEYAKENNLKINPVCPYTVTYLERNPQYKDLLEKSE